MPNDETFDVALAQITVDWGITSKPISGGTCYLLNGDVLCAVYKESLILRLGESMASVALQEPFIKPVKITSRTMRGWVMIEPAILQHRDRLERWLAQARSVVANLAFDFYGQNQ